MQNLSDDANAVRNVERVEVWSQVHVRLLLAIRPDKRINLLALDIVDLLDGLLDLLFRSTNVDDEHESVDLFDLLHGRLGGEGVLEDGVLVQLLKGLNGFPWVLWLPFRLEGLGQEEVHIEAFLGRLPGN